MFLAHVAIVESGFGRAAAAWAHVYSSNGCINVWPTKRVCEFGPASNVISIHKCQNYDTHTHTIARAKEMERSQANMNENFTFVSSLRRLPVRAAHSRKQNRQQPP